MNNNQQDDGRGAETIEQRDRRHTPTVWERVANIFANIAYQPGRISKHAAGRTPATNARARKHRRRRQAKKDRRRSRPRYTRRKGGQ